MEAQEIFCAVLTDTRKQLSLYPIAVENICHHFSSQGPV
jgi:hypothetical protein